MLMQGFQILSISFDYNFTPLLVIVACAWLVPMVLSYLRITRLPSVVVEIFVGFLVCRPMLSQFSPETIKVLEFLALTGFIMLMFFGGLEIDVNKILQSVSLKKLNYKKLRKNPFYIGLFLFMCTLVLCYLISLIISRIIDIPNLWYFSIIMATTSVGIILPILKNREEINTEFGQIIISTAALADILSIILFTLTAFIIKNGFQIEIFFILVIFIVFYIFYRIGIRLKSIAFFKRISYQLAHAELQIRIRGTILILLIFVVISQLIDVEAVLLGAFLAGLLLSVFLYKARSLLLIKLDALGYGFFIPVFFIMVGAQFNPSALSEFDNKLWPFLGILLLALYLVKILPALFLKNIFGTRKALSGGILLASRLSLIIAASKIGLDLNIISPGINACFIIMAVVTCLMSPLLYNLINPRCVSDTDKIVVVGGSSTSVLLLRRLKMHGMPAVIIEESKKRYTDILKKGLNAVHGSGLEEAVYKEINLEPSNFVVILTGIDNKNMEIARLLKTKLSHEKIISRSNTSAVELKLLRLGVDLIDVSHVLATTIENLILRPTTYHAMVETFDSFIVEEITVSNSSLDRQQVKDIPFHADGSLLLIKRGHDMHVPHGNTHIRINDRIVVFGTNMAVNLIKQTLSSTKLN